MDFRFTIKQENSETDSKAKKSALVFSFYPFIFLGNTKKEWKNVLKNSGLVRAHIKTTVHEKARTGFHYPFKDFS